MRIAVYRPGAPASETPSGGGGRTEPLEAALRSAGHELATACRFRACGGGSPARNERLRRLGLDLADRLLARHRGRPAAERPELWLSCGAGDEAPDWIGPAVSRGLGIPYVLLDPRPDDAPSSRPAAGWAPMRSALAAADAVIALGAAGFARLRDGLDRPERLVRLPLALDLAAVQAAWRDRERHRSALAARLLLSPETPWLITIAGTQAGEPEASSLLARALSRIPFLDWQLVVLGGGPAQAAVETTLLPLPRQRLRLWPPLRAEDLLPLHTAGDLFLGRVDGEGDAQAMLAAMASGLPIVAGRGAAAGEIVRNGVTGTLTMPGNAESFGNAVGFLLRHPSFRASFAANARGVAIAEHDLAAAAQRLDETLRRVISEGPRRPD